MDSNIPLLPAWSIAIEQSRVQSQTLSVIIMCLQFNHDCNTDKDIIPVKVIQLCKKVWLLGIYGHISCIISICKINKTIKKTFSIY